jgi:hypothetical protein
VSPDFDYNKVIAEVTIGIFRHYFEATLHKLGRSISHANRKRLAESGHAFTGYLQMAVSQVSRGKTFLSDAPVPIRDIYVPLDLSIGSKTLSDCKWSDLAPYGDKLILAGTAGSGKSTAFRMYFLEELELTRTVPILVPLREINDLSGSLFDLILRTVNIGEGTLTADHLRIAAKHGLIALFLDGLDEVHDEYFPTTVKAIQDFSADFPDSLVVVSSRPSPDFQSWEDFTVLNVQPMKLEQSVELITRVPFDDEEAREKFLHILRTQLFNSHSTFASNPLLLTLMLMIYEANADIPIKWHQFYDQAFMILYSKHDAKKKGGYKRQHRSGLDIDDFRLLFSYFSASTQIIGRSSFDEIQLRQDMSLAISGLGFQCSVDDYLYDCETCVCLFVRDGLTFRFLHRSFQEYFAAFYIARHASERRAKQILETQSINFGNMLFLMSLHGLNPERYYELVLLPRVKQVLTAVNYEGTVTPAVVRSHFKLYDASVSLRRTFPSTRKTSKGASQQEDKPKLNLSALRVSWGINDTSFSTYLAVESAYPLVLYQNDTLARNRIIEILRERQSKFPRSHSATRPVRVSELSEDDELYVLCKQLNIIGVPALAGMIEAKEKAEQFLSQSDLAASLLMPETDDRQS